MDQYNYYETLTSTGQDAENDVNLILSVLKKLNKGIDFSNSTCIDVGCGNGNLIKEIKNTSIDIAVTSVEKIIKNTIDKSKLDNIFQKNIDESKEALKKLKSN